MPVDQYKVDIDDLSLGMYVSRLDRPWIETPFPLQGYYIRELSDITDLRQYCHYVYIDIRRGKGPDEHVFLQTLDSPALTEKASAKAISRVNVKKLRANKGTYALSTTPRQEVKKAIKMKKLAELAISYIDVALKNNTQLPIKETKKVVAVMVEDIIRNPDAFIWLNKIKNKDSYLYGHTVRTTIWAITLGRHLGISHEALNNLALAIMVSEVGKTSLPDDLLTKDKNDFSYDEFNQYQSHVSKSLEILSQSQGIDKQVLNIVANMHERHDGSGYPRSITGDKIPYLAKIAGISSTYDEMTFPRHQEFGLSPSKCIMKLYDLIDEKFQKDLVEEFIQAIGIYPAGTLVELSTSETAMVLEQNPDRKLRPKVILLLDEVKNPYRKFKILDLIEKEQRNGIKLDILYSLPIGSYGADPAKIYSSAFTSKWPFSIAS